MEEKKHEEQNRMEKRKRGRPRKTDSHTVARATTNVSDEKVTLSGHLPEFFKIYMPDLCSEKMFIPPDFVKKFGGNIPRTCTLKIPSGLSWKVDTIGMNDVWFFENGWPEFVEENSIKVHDVLTFCFVGKSTFTVKMFSPNGCVKGGRAKDASKGNESQEDFAINGTNRRRRRRMASRG